METCQSSVLLTRYLHVDAGFVHLLVVGLERSGRKDSYFCQVEASVQRD